MIKINLVGIDGTERLVELPINTPLMRIHQLAFDFIKAIEIVEVLYDV